MRLLYDRIPTLLGEVYALERDGLIVEMKIRPLDIGELLGRAEQRFGEAVAEAGMEKLRRELAQYLSGAGRIISASASLELVCDFDRKVLSALMSVGYGEVVTYGELASRAGVPGAARAVGSALRRNPLPILVPCHRVLPVCGGLGGYAGGVDIKRRLLEIEGAVVTGRVGVCA